MVEKPESVLQRLWKANEFLRARDLYCLCDVPVRVGLPAVAGIPPLCVVCGCSIGDGPNSKGVVFLNRVPGGASDRAYLKRQSDRSAALGDRKSVV